jgi:hypothetical protein
MLVVGRISGRPLLKNMRTVLAIVVILCAAILAAGRRPTFEAGL